MVCPSWLSARIFVVLDSLIIGVGSVRDSKCWMLGDLVLCGLFEHGGWCRVICALFFSSVWRCNIVIEESVQGRALCSVFQGFWKAFLLLFDFIFPFDPGGGLCCIISNVEVQSTFYGVVCSVNMTLSVGSVLRRCRGVLILKLGRSELQVCVSFCLLKLRLQGGFYRCLNSCFYSLNHVQVTLGIKTRGLQIFSHLLTFSVAVRKLSFNLENSLGLVRIWGRLQDLFWLEELCAGGSMAYKFLFINPNFVSLSGQQICQHFCATVGTFLHDWWVAFKSIALS